MPEVRITIGGREFDVACQEGEEHFLKSAAQLLDNEASVLLNQIGRMPEPRMLLMAGLMLADKSAGMDEQLRQLERQSAAQAAEIEALKAKPTEQVEVAVIPAEVTETLAELAARAEALAASAEEKARTI